MKVNTIYVGYGVTMSVEDMLMFSMDLREFDEGKTLTAIQRFSVPSCGDLADDIRQNMLKDYDQIAIVDYAEYEWAFITTKDFLIIDCDDLYACEDNNYGTFHPEFNEEGMEQIRAFFGKYGRRCKEPKVCIVADGI